jgi:hypothetical protein
MKGRITAIQSMAFHSRAGIENENFIMNTKCLNE